MGICGAAGHSAWVAKTWRGTSASKGTSGAAVNPRADEPAGQPGEAVPRLGGIGDGFQIIEAQPARWRHRHRRAFAHRKFPGPHPAVAGIGHRVVAVKIVEVPGYARHCQIGGGGADGHPLQPDGAGHQAVA